MKKLTALSLFTGAGGLDYGFEAAGFETVVAIEMNRRCCETLELNRSWKVIDQDINSVTSAAILGAAALPEGEPDILIGGPPCQPFSKSGFWVTGDAKRLSDPRASTLEAYLRILAEARPRAFLLENVEGLGFRGKDEGLQLINTKLAAINAVYGTNYKANIGILNAADFGVPQMRKRVFVVGSREGQPFKFPQPTHSALPGDLATQSLPYTTAWDALHDLAPPNDEEVQLSGKWADLLPTIPEGNNYLWHTERGGGEPLFGWRRRYWSFLLKLAKNQPSWTIQAQPGPATGPFHWENRRLTRREMARLQTFPDDIELSGSLADAQRQLGNAVPSLLAEVLARSIGSQFFKRRYSRVLELAVSLAKGSVPPASATVKVPAKYLLLRGLHEAHPGTGKGLRALRRESATLLTPQ
jgi:DNA (cytosine-5)-methyltransferase 1